MKKLIWILPALVFLFAACGETAPVTTAAPQTWTEETAAPASEAEPEPAELAGVAETVVFFTGEGTLENAGSRAAVALNAPDDLEPYAAYFSEEDLAKAKAMTGKDGPTALFEAYLDDPTAVFSLQSVTPEAEHVSVFCSLSVPEPEEGETPPEHGLHLFFVIHLDEAYAGGVPLQIMLSDD